MQTKRDQVRAYMFVVGRVKAAVLRANPDSASMPFRRSTSSTIAGVVITVLVSAIFLVIGLLLPGTSDAWRNPKAVVLAKATGTRFLYVDGTLHPLLNFTSAQLLLGGVPQVVEVTETSIDGVPRAAPLGIPGVPDALPGAAQLVTTPPVACSTPSATGTTARLVVSAGNDLPTRPLTGAVVVALPGGAQYVVAQGRRYAVPDRRVLVAMAMTARPVPVSRTWLNTLTAQADLRAPAIAGRGSAGVAMAGVGSLRVGQVLVLGAGPGQGTHLLVLGNGVAPISDLVAELVLGDPRTVTAYGGAGPRAVVVSPAAVAAVPPATFDGVPATWPASLDGARDLGRADALCSVARGPGDPPDLLAIDAGRLADAIGGPRDGDSNLIAVRPGAGLLAQVGTAPGGALTLVTGGSRYAIPSAEVAQTLGYPPQAAVPVAGELLSGIPEGPVLDPVSARTPRPAAGGSS